jgi:two-component system invasion response regulator UvrY
MINVLIAAHHVLMRSGIRRLMDDESDLTVITEAGRIEQVLATMRLNKIDVLLMDVNLPGMDSLEASVSQVISRKRARAKRW